MGKITINVERGEAGLLHATSPEMRDLFVSGETLGEIKKAVPAVIAAIQKEKSGIVHDFDLAYSTLPPLSGVRWDLR